jgi:hypothetical protein
MRIKSLLVATAMAVATLSNVRADINFLGTATNTWIGYNPVGSAPPILNTTAPGSITAPAGGFRYGRSTDAGGAFSPSPLFRTGDIWRIQFDGVIGNNTTFRIEFSNPTRTAGLVLGMQNANATGADFLQVDSLGTAGPSDLFTGNLGGVAGGTQRVFGDVSITIQSGSTALISGSLSDSTGVRWNTPFTMDLGTTAPTLFAAVNINANGGVTAINTLSWSLTAVPEPGTLTLAGLGLVALGISCRRSARKR